jgi:hypothetical protein
MLKSQGAISVFSSAFPCTVSDRKNAPATIEDVTI